MSNLLQLQIHESCKLVMPEGLKELMSDISREVLRSQPENLYQFITNYLQALLDARETLSTACRVCGEICSCSCVPELDYELQCIGLSTEDIDKAKKIIQEHYDKGQVKESNLLMKLAKKTSITETQLAELKKAIHRAYHRHILKRKDRQVSFAKTYKVGSESSQESSISTESSASDFYKPSYSTDGSATIDMQTKELCLSARYRNYKVSKSAATLAGSYVAMPMNVPYSVHKVTESATTLAGSYVDLPMNVPYSAHKVTESATTLNGSYIDLPMNVPYSAHKVTESAATLAGSYVDLPMNVPYSAHTVTESAVTLNGSYIDLPMNVPYSAHKVTESAATLAGLYVDLPMKMPYSDHKSEDNVGAVLKNNAPTLNILKTLLFTEGQSNSHRRVTYRRDQTGHPSIGHFNNSNYKHNDNEDINDTIQHIVHLCEAPLHQIVDETQDGCYKIVKENLDENSSGSS